MRGTRLAFWLAMGMTALALAPLAQAAGTRAAAKAAPPSTAEPDVDGDQEEERAPEAVPPSTAPAATSAAAEPTTFEGLLRGAIPTGDLGTLLAPWSGRCDGEKRDLDRVRCQATRAYLRKIIPRQSFSAVVDDPAVLEVSEFDASIKGYHLSVAGCLACTRPITVGRTKDQRLISVKAPAKQAETLHAALELSRNSVGFDSLGEAKGWLDQSRPELRTQFVFKAAQTEWSFGSHQGYALSLLGFRVFNRCSGEVLISRPPSTGTADIVALEEGCRRGDASTPGRQANPAAANLPPEMTKNEIEAAMNTIRPQVFGCFEKFKVPGLAQFDFVVAGNGTVNNVRLSGAFFGTPTGACLLDAAKDAHFPRFAKARQQFVYPFFLRQ